MKKIVKNEYKKWLLATFCVFIPIVAIYMQETSTKHIIPKAIKVEALKALSYYPELKHTAIEFKFKNDIKKSIMQAQPTFWSLLKAKKNRSYKIFISESFQIEGRQFSTADIPKNVLIGWLGHELGHVMDYRDRSSLNLIWFGIKYTFSDSYIKEAERAADTYAVEKNMDGYILETKNFILNHTDLSEAYKDRIKKYYLSPDEIVKLVEDRDLDAALESEH
ncbi:MAG: hypothetical protein NWQ38_02560 [Cellulophaga sp.]|nr:hypothetical protein [Cellulophaga sp.]